LLERKERAVVTIARSPEESPQELESDWHPMLMARAWPKEEIQADFDTWEVDKHIAELALGPGVVFVAYFLNVLDGLPEAYKGSGYCMAYYTGKDLEGMFAWLRSPELAAAVEDGSQWFGRFNSVDYETFTGNVCPVRAVVNNLGQTPPESAPILVERWEVSDADAEEFDEWLDNTHLPAVGGHEGVVRVRTFTAVREGIPIPYYYSPGNRMLVAELRDPVNFRETLLSPELMTRLEDSTRWDLRLPYVKRDVYSYVAHTYSPHGGAY
jgi:hypothetical protein